MNKLLTLCFGLFLAIPALADQNKFNVLWQDSNIVTDVKADDTNVWIKLAKTNLSDQLTVRISNKNKDMYRAWSTGNPDLVSTGFRGNDVWSDRVQTEANFIEYWHNDVLVLHLERK